MIGRIGSRLIGGEHPTRVSVVYSDVHACHQPANIPEMPLLLSGNDGIRIGKRSCALLLLAGQRAVSCEDRCRKLTSRSCGGIEHRGLLVKPETRQPLSTFLQLPSSLMRCLSSRLPSRLNPACSRVKFHYGMPNMIGIFLSHVHRYLARMQPSPSHRPISAVLMGKNHTQKRPNCGAGSSFRQPHVPVQVQHLVDRQLWNGYIGMSLSSCHPCAHDTGSTNRRAAKRSR
ncbi:hypothetical protein BJ508DRAFT_52966 [Ascobolus immersus RN42]|uniref:Uncharacterized protein n=1 Tax=Ascobolus immersus RN42 TaxID=1160509 RepID=A0A3N4HUH5_ASCIM|nr:hypothetical protein BJ508DRAFT_52966 [Ascobolus immersus RN42]